VLSRLTDKRYSRPRCANTARGHAVAGEKTYKFPARPDTRSRDPADAAGAEASLAREIWDCASPECLLQNRRATGDAGSVIREWKETGTKARE